MRLVLKINQKVWLIFGQNKRLWCCSFLDHVELCHSLTLFLNILYWNSVFMAQGSPVSEFEINQRQLFFLVNFCLERQAVVLVSFC